MLCVSLSQPVTLSSSTLWSEFLEKKLCSKQGVGYLKDLKFFFSCNASIPYSQFLIAGKKFSRDKVANFLQQKMLLSPNTLLFNQKKRSKSSKSSICFQFQLLLNVFILSFMYSFKSMRFCQCLRSVSFTGVSQQFSVCIRFSVSLLNRHVICYFLPSRSFNL